MKSKMKPKREKKKPRKEKGETKSHEMKEKC